MTPERWVKIQKIFAEALKREPAERSDYLIGVCTDPSLREEVELMIAAHEQGGSSFLDPPFAESKETLKSGSRIGQYEVLEAIGAGGMGEVYRARDSKLGREVAIKILPAAFSRDPERLARFQREARFLASLNHANIASIYGVEDAGDTRALIMELVEGPALAARIKAGPIPIDEALPIARQICEALEYAHEHGVVHRDLKPANIKISREGSVKILDFGLAKAVQGEAVTTDMGDSQTLSDMATRAGALLGTAAYMSPEQAKGKPVDRRADIWAFGCVLYEMLTGKKAFVAETVTETLAAVLKNEPDWSLLKVATPIHVRVLLHRCLQKDPRQRLRDIGDARISLDEVLSGVAERALPIVARASVWRRVVPWALFVIAAAALALLAFVQLRPRSAPAPDAIRFQVPLPETASFVGDAALSPDGRHLAFAAIAQDGHSQIWVRDLDSLESRPLRGTEGVYGSYLFWSPDSREVAFRVGNSLERIDISGGSPTVISTGAQVVGGSWNSDGVILYGNWDSLMKVPAGGGEPSVLIKPDRSRGAEAIWHPSFLPDGRHFLYEMTTPLSNSGWGVFVGSLDTNSKEQPPAKPIADGWVAAYASIPGSKLGYILFLQYDGNLMAQAFDLSRLEMKGNAISVAKNIRTFSTSTAGVLAYIEGSGSPLQLAWFDRQGKILGRLGEPGIVPLPALSPDGKTVAVPLLNHGSFGMDFWLYSVETGARTRFTFEGKRLGYPVWSPDGSHIAFSVSHPGNVTVVQKPVNGMGQEETIDERRGEEPTTPLDWSRDGRYLIEEVHAKTDSIWVLPLSPQQGASGHTPSPLLNEGFNVVNGRFSPNGQWIAYDSDESGRDEIFVRTFPQTQGKWQVSTNGGTRPVWSRDGKELYYIAQDGNLMAVDVKSRPDNSFETGDPKVLFNPQTGPLRTDRFDVAKDGRFLIPTLAQQSAVPINVVVNWEAMLKK
jgi:Tol biopolymer transport system component/tRNA A-37 threonylcarbamoyl transferase component Bud32